MLSIVSVLNGDGLTGVCLGVDGRVPPRVRRRASLCIILSEPMVCSAALRSVSDRYGPSCLCGQCAKQSTDRRLPTHEDKWCAVVCDGCPMRRPLAYSVIHRSTHLTIVCQIDSNPSICSNCLSTQSQDSALLRPQTNA